jgi:hypothetical protein
MGARIAIAVAVFVVLLVVAYWLERRRRADVPTQSAVNTPEQLDRHDFERPDASWLVVLFTSKTCDSCAGLMEKAAPLASDDVAVEEVEYFAQRDLHERYHINAAPLTLVADREGVVRASYAGAFNAAELWNRLAALREDAS